jgi:DNA-binding transcriptional LysR family regulator
MSLSSLFLDAFYTCAQTAHFTKAAERLNITQSALSQRIKNLEEELGLTLFIRDRSGLRLTEAGERLLRYCQTKDSLEQEALSTMKARFNGNRQRHIRIGGYSSVMRSLILPKLKPLMKDESTSLKFTTREVHELPSLFRSGEIDYMILDHAFQMEGVVHHKIGTEENVLVQRKNYKGPEVYLDHDERDMTTVRFLKKRSGSELDRIFLDDIYGIIDGVRMGFGKAIVPVHLIESDSSIEVLGERKSISSPIVLHYYEQPFYSQLHQELLESLIPR